MRGFRIWGGVGWPVWSARVLRRRSFQSVPLQVRGVYSFISSPVSTVLGMRALPRAIVWLLSARAVVRLHDCPDWSWSYGFGRSTAHRVDALGSGVSGSLGRSKALGYSRLWTRPGDSFGYAFIVAIALLGRNKQTQKCHIEMLDSIDHFRKALNLRFLNPALKDSLLPAMTNHPESLMKRCGLFGCVSFREELSCSEHDDAERRLERR